MHSNENEKLDADWIGGHPVSLFVLQHEWNNSSHWIVGEIANFFYSFQLPINSDSPILPLFLLPWWTTLCSSSDLWPRGQKTPLAGQCWLVPSWHCHSLTGSCQLLFWLPLHFGPSSEFKCVCVCQCKTYITEKKCETFHEVSSNWTLNTPFCGFRKMNLLFPLSVKWLP